MAVHFPVSAVPLYSFPFVTSRGVRAVITFLVSPDHPTNIAIDIGWYGNETPEDHTECRQVVEKIMREALGNAIQSVGEKVAATPQEAEYNIAHFMQTGKIPNGWDS